MKASSACCISWGGVRHSAALKCWLQGALTMTQADMLLSKYLLCNPLSVHAPRKCPLDGPCRMNSKQTLSVSTDSLRG